MGAASASAAAVLLFTPFQVCLFNFSIAAQIFGMHCLFRPFGIRRENYGQPHVGIVAAHFLLYFVP